MKKVIVNGKTFYLQTKGVVRIDPYTSKKNELWLSITYAGNNTENVGTFRDETEREKFVLETFTLN